MARIARSLVGGLVYHVLNRGNAGKTVFRKVADYRAFVRLMVEANKNHPLQIYAYCLMPSHFHIVLRPNEAHDLSKWMHWLMSTHVRRYHAHYHSFGHIWQGRYKGFAVKDDRYLLTVLRYVEANPVRAGLAHSAAKWSWSSHRETIGLKPRTLVSPLPIELCDDWTSYVDEPQTTKELDLLRECINRQLPLAE